MEFTHYSLSKENLNVLKDEYLQLSETNDHIRAKLRDIRESPITVVRPYRIKRLRGYYDVNCGYMMAIKKQLQNKHIVDPTAPL